MIGIVLTIINVICFVGTWYILGIASIYKMLIEDYKELLDIASRMKIAIETYEAKYNPETLQVEPVKVAEPKCSFKPFDKVLVRYNEDSVWRCEFFSHYNTFNKRYPYVCLSGVYKYCIHYEGNQHLLDTTNNSK